MAVESVRPPVRLVKPFAELRAENLARERVRRRGRQRNVSHHHAGRVPARRPALNALRPGTPPGPVDDVQSHVEGGVELGDWSVAQVETGQIRGERRKVVTAKGVDAIRSRRPRVEHTLRGDGPAARRRVGGAIPGVFDVSPEPGEVGSPGEEAADPDDGDSIAVRSQRQLPISPTRAPLPAWASRPRRKASFKDASITCSASVIFATSRPSASRNSTSAWAVAALSRFTLSVIVIPSAGNDRRNWRYRPAKHGNDAAPCRRTVHRTSIWNAASSASGSAIHDPRTGCSIHSPGAGAVRAAATMPAADSPSIRSRARRSGPWNRTSSYTSSTVRSYGSVGGGADAGSGSGSRSTSRISARE